MDHFSTDNIAEEIRDIEADISHQRQYIQKLRNSEVLKRARNDIFYLEQKLSSLIDDLEVLIKMTNRSIEN